jgi:hypothetical protein
MRAVQSGHVLLDYTKLPPWFSCPPAFRTAASNSVILTGISKRILMGCVGLLSKRQDGSRCIALQCLLVPNDLIHGKGVIVSQTNGSSFMCRYHSKTTLHPSALATTNVKSCRSSPIDSTGSSTGTASRGNRLRICTITKLASSKAKFSTQGISRCISPHGHQRYSRPRHSRGPALKGR